MSRPRLCSRTSAVSFTGRSCSGASLRAGVTVKMRPPCPRRTRLTSTGSSASGRTITSPTSTSSAGITSSTNRTIPVSKIYFIHCANTRCLIYQHLMTSTAARSVHKDFFPERSVVPALRTASDEVVALFDVLDEAGVGGFPAQEFLGDGAGGGHVGAEQGHQHALVFPGGQG